MRSRCAVVAVLLILAAFLASGPAAEAPSAKRFSLHTNNLPLSKALAELARQTGIPVEDKGGVGDTPVAIDLDGVTFWQALDALADAARAVPSLSSTGITLAKRPEEWRKPPTSYDGRFRLVVKQVAVTRDLEADRSTCALTLELAWAPDLLPIFLETKAQSVRMLDERKNVVPVVDEGSVLAEADGKLSHSLNLNVPALPRTQSRIGLIEGKLSAMAPSKMLTFTFATLEQLAKAPADAPERRLAQEGAECRIDKLTLVRDRWTVRVAVALAPGGRQLGSWQANSWPVNNEMYLVSADGKRRIPSSSYVLESASEKRAVLSYHFVDKGGAKRGRPQDWKVVYRSPAMIVDVPISFRFENVPLP